MRHNSRHFHMRGLLAVFAGGLFVLTALAAHGPRIMIWADGELVLDTAVRDNEPVVAKNLGNYLNRVAFRSTEKLKIQADKATPDKAVLKARFELHLAVNRSDAKNELPPVLKVTFGELRLARSKSKSNPDQWFLTDEGVELIEKSIPQQQK